MSTVLQIFKEYSGTGYYSILFLASLIYLWYTEEDKRLRYMLVYIPGVIQLLFFVPYFYMLYNKLDAGTYYRILWLLPMTVVIAYSACRVLGRHTRAGLILAVLLLLLSGTCVYQSSNLSKAENLYHLPQETIDICDMIRPAKGAERVWAAFPPEEVHYVRQYTTTIQMPFGRDNLVEEWGNEKHPLFLLYQQETIPAREFAEASTESLCNYAILLKSKKIDGSLTDHQFKKIGETEHYLIYQNLAVPLP